jgi:phospholipase A1
MTSLRVLLAFALLTCNSARAEFILSAPDSSVAAGSPLRVDLIVLNESDSPLRVELPLQLRARLETASSATTLDFQPERSGALEVPPRQFLRIGLSSEMPRDAANTATLTLSEIQANRLTFNVAAPPPQQGTALIDKPPPLALSVYEPVYFLVGGDGGLNAKFQISLRFQLFDDRGRLARRMPFIDDLYLSFSQTALWDLSELSKPFKDSSYRPRLFYANYDLARYFDGNLRVGVETGIGHESNGKEAEDSRSFNMLYARPTLTWGDPDGLRAYFAPLIHNYIAESDNEDIADYRGYVDWLFGVGSKGGLDFWAVVRKGTRSDFGSLELNASYPLSKLSGGDLRGWLLLQYFNGYGESLLDYNRKLDSQLRLGIAIAL